MLVRMVARSAWAAGSEVRASWALGGRNLCGGHDIPSKFTLASCVGVSRGVHSTPVVGKAEDRRTMLSSMPKKDEGTEGERTKDLDASLKGSGGMFPDEGTPDLLFDGVRFADLPILHVKVSKNNSILILTDSAGAVKLSRSCGIEGFKNARKGTNIAAQATGISLATRALNRGFRNVRVKVNGLGAGRVAAVKGLTMGGLNVVSITDSTPIMFTLAQKPRKARKL